MSEHNIAELVREDEKAMMTFCELKCKEVVNLCDGSKLGNICDLEIDEKSGRIEAIIVPGPCRFFGLLRSDEELVIPFCKITKIGEDCILVEVKDI